MYEQPLPTPALELRRCVADRRPSAVFPHQTNTIKRIRSSFLFNTPSEVVPHPTSPSTVSRRSNQSAWQKPVPDRSNVHRARTAAVGFIFSRATEGIDSVGGRGLATSEMVRVASGRVRIGPIGLRLPCRHFRRSDNLNLDWTSMKGSGSSREPVAWGGERQAASEFTE